MNPTSILSALAAPFPADQVQWKPGPTTGNKAMALPFVNASAIQERLDTVCGADWEARYEFLEGGVVLCCLRLFIDGTWHERCDVGQCGKGEENGTKAGVSDSFKRAARAWGVGRYLCRIPKTWAAYDASKRRFLETPQLPSWAMPKAITTNAAKNQPEPVIHAHDLADEVAAEDARISEAEERQLVELLRTTGANVERFLKHFSVRSVGSLRSRDFLQAVEMLRRKAAAAPGKAATGLPAKNAAASGVDNTKAKH
jgi:hypothetical protein